jgi:hypothetical protein
MGFRGSKALERGAAADLWRNTLSQIPSLYGRMVFLSALRDPNNGRYVHHGLELVFGAEKSDTTLRQSHQSAFSEWLSYGLEAQKADLDLYISSLEEDKATVLDAWTRLKPYENLVPSTARRVDRKLFLIDLETLLALLRNEYGVVPDPDT